VARGAWPGGAGRRGVTQNRSAEELAMRALCAERLRQRWPAARLIHELPLRYSTRRIDLAAVTPDQIIAVEIKSSRDTLTRLEAQLRGFAPCCAQVWVALAPVWDAQLPMLKKPGPAPNSFYHVQQRTEAQRIIEAVSENSPWITTWTCDAEAGAMERSGGVYGCENSHPWPWLLLDLLHVAELEALGVAFISFRDNLDLTTPSGRLMFQIIGAMAEFERALIQERVRAGLRNAKAKGNKLGRPRAVVNIEEISALREQGLSWARITHQTGASKGTAQRVVKACASRSGNA